MLGQTESVLGGTLSLSSPATSASPAGTYSITPSGLTSSNYAITNVDGALTVIPASPVPLTVNATTPEVHSNTIPYLLSPTQTPNTVTPALIQKQGSPLQVRQSVSERSQSVVITNSSTEQSTSNTDGDSNSEPTTRPDLREDGGIKQVPALNGSSLAGEGILSSLFEKRIKATKKKSSSPW